MRCIAALAASCLKQMSPYGFILPSHNGVVLCHLLVLSAEYGIVADAFRGEANGRLFDIPFGLVRRVAWRRRSVAGTVEAPAGARYGGAQRSRQRMWKRSPSTVNGSQM